MGQLPRITFELPATTAKEQAAHENLLALRVNRKLNRSADAGIQMPAVEFQSSKEKTPSIRFGSEYQVVLNPQVSKRSEPKLRRLKLEEISSKFDNHIVSIDHAGVNLSAMSFGSKQIDNLLDVLGASTNLYTYPTGEPWYFIIPSTLQEYSNNISDFSKVRTDKFELVIDEEGPTPLIQIDFLTSLSQAGVEKLLPPPFGFGFPGLSQYFRSVFVEHPWQGFEMRFDFRYKTDLLNEWSSGEWLVKEGKRFRARSGT